MLTNIVHSLILASALTVADTSGEVDKLLERIPAKDAATEREVSEALLNLGPEAVADLCLRLRPSKVGGDSKARYALGGLVTHVFRPGADSSDDARSRLSKTLAAALNREREREVRQFLIFHLGRVGKDEAVPALASFIDDSGLCDAALRALLTIHTESAAKAIVQSFPEARGDQRLAVIKALGDLGDRTHLETLAGLASGEGSGLRSAALYALASGRHETFPDLLDTLKSAESPLPLAERTSLSLLYLRRLVEAGEKEKAVQICRRVLGERKDSHLRCAALNTLDRIQGFDAMDQIIAAASDPDAALAAVALGLAARRDLAAGREATTKFWLDQLADAPALSRARIAEMLGRRGDALALPALERLVGSTDPDTCYAAVVAIARIRREPALPTLLKAIEASKGEPRVRLLSLTTRLGGNAALDIVRASFDSKDEGARQAAIDTLATWPDASAAPALLSIARATKSTEYHDKAMSAHIKLVLAARVPRERILEIYREALGAARTAAARRSVLEGLARLRTVESLELIAGLIEDESVGKDARRAAVEIALPRESGRGGLRGARVVEVLEKVVKVSRDEDLRRRARRYLRELPRPDALNIADGRPVESNVPHQGDNVPKNAVDGTRRTSWFGSKWPAWLQVDLEKEISIDTVHVWFYYRDSRSYQYAIEVSADGENWKRVVDRSDNRKAGRREGFAHRFPAVSSRYVRLHVLKNSANEAVHVNEIKVYAEGKSPPGLKPSAEATRRDF